MKKTIIVLAFSLFSTLFYAQVENHNGSQHLKLGSNFFGNDNYFKVVYNYGISEMFSVGAGVYAINDSYGFIRGDFYFDSVLPLPDNLNVYAGVELGVFGIDFLNFDPQLGIGYSISRNLDLFFEIGNTGSAGISFKF